MGAKGSKTKTSMPSSAPSTKDAWTPELFISKAKEEFYHGNEAFRDAKFDQAKKFYYEALDNLRQWNEYLHLKGSNHSVEGKSNSNTNEKAGESCRDTKKP